MDGPTAEDELNQLYKGFEDIVSRKMYSWRGIPDERVSAALHKFLEQDVDTEVISISLLGTIAVHRYLKGGFFILGCGSYAKGTGEDALLAPS